MSRNKYVLITPAKNEEELLGRVINSVANQDIKPIKWIIVDDGSTDTTPEIIKEAEGTFPWVCGLTTESVNKKREFGAKAKAFNLALQILKNTSYDFIGNLDADITLPQNYYSFLMAKMYKKPKVGLASGVCLEKIKDRWTCITITYEHAVGAVQFFKRECFQAVGGYQPVTIGGVDTLAELTAKMLGWKVVNFSELPIYHHRPVDSLNARSKMKINFRAGMTDYYMGTHPVFAVAKALRRWKQHPILFSIIIQITGFCYAWGKSRSPDASPELAEFVRSDQMRRLKNFFLKKLNNINI